MKEQDRFLHYGKCVKCKCFVRQEDFRNHLSYQEYESSGLCQNCQDTKEGKAH